MKLISVTMGAAGLIIAGFAMAVDMPVEIKVKCGECHAIDKTIVGPSFMSVSAKYKGDKEAVGKIAASITEGGSFGWMLGTMPKGIIGANDVEIKSMSEFIAGLGKTMEEKDNGNMGMDQMEKSSMGSGSMKQGCMCKMGGTDKMGGNCDSMEDRFRALEKRVDLLQAVVEKLLKK